MHEILVEMINPFERAPHADGPGHRRAADLEHVFDFVHQLDGVAPLAIQLVDKRKNGRSAQAADFHQLDGTLLHAFGAVDHHQRGIHRGQGTIRILGEIFVTGGVQQIDNAVFIGELHHRGGDGNPALLFQLHPIGRRMAGGFAPLDGAGELDRATEQQQLFGQRGFAGIGVGDDGESTAPVHLG